MTIRTMFQPERAEAFSEEKSREINQKIKEERSRLQSGGVRAQDTGKTKQKEDIA